MKAKKSSGNIAFFLLNPNYSLASEKLSNNIPEYMTDMVKLYFE